MFQRKIVITHSAGFMQQEGNNLFMTIHVGLLKVNQVLSF